MVQIARAATLAACFVHKIAWRSLIFASSRVRSAKTVGDRRSDSRGDIAIDHLWLLHSKSLPVVFLLAPAAPLLLRQPGPDRSFRSQSVYAACVGRCCYRPHNCLPGRPARLG